MQRTGAEQCHQCDHIFEAVRLQTLDQVLHAARFKLEYRSGFRALQHVEAFLVIQRDRGDIQRRLAILRPPLVDHLQRPVDDGERTQTKEVELHQSGVFNVAFIKLGDRMFVTEVIVEELREQAEKKKIQISVFSDRDVKMMGNHTLLLRMMMNLVQNAISYGKEHGHIDILWKEQGDMIIGEVKDDGIGIDQEDIPKIWDRFYRVDKSRSRENGGTGLGLSMVHFIVAVHGGQIHVESKNGEGTSFIFQFPKM